MAETIPQDILERARKMTHQIATELDATIGKDMRPAIAIIATALLAEREAQIERDAGIAEVWAKTEPADDTTMAKIIATAMSEAGKHTAQAIREQKAGLKAGKDVG